METTYVIEIHRDGEFFDIFSNELPSVEKARECVERNVSAYKGAGPYLEPNEEFVLVKVTREVIPFFE